LPFFLLVLGWGVLWGRWSYLVFGPFLWLSCVNLLRGLSARKIVGPLPEKSALVTWTLFAISLITLAWYALRYGWDAFAVGNIEKVFNWVFTATGLLSSFLKEPAETGSHPNWWQRAKSRFGV